MRTVRMNVLNAPRSGLLMDSMSAETLDGLDTGVRPPELKDRPSVQKAREKIYRNEDGEIGLPTEMHIGALKLAGAQVKNGKDKISAAGGKKTQLFEFLVINQDFVVLTGPVNEKTGELDWVIDRRKGIGYQAKTPTAVCITRPKFLVWGFDLEFEYDETMIRCGTVQQLWTNALSRQGLGAFRPNKGGPFGRSRITQWLEKDSNASDSEFKEVLLANQATEEEAKPVGKRKLKKLDEGDDLDPATLGAGVDNVEAS